MKKHIFFAIIFVVAFSSLSAYGCSDCWGDDPEMDKMVEDAYQEEPRNEEPVQE